MTGLLLPVLSLIFHLKFENSDTRAPVIAQVCNEETIIILTRNVEIQKILSHPVL